jgi:hypothetical protein
MCYKCLGVLNYEIRKNRVLCHSTFWVNVCGNGFPEIKSPISLNHSVGYWEVKAWSVLCIIKIHAPSTPGSTVVSLDFNGWLLFWRSLFRFEAALCIPAGYFQYRTCTFFCMTAVAINETLFRTHLFICISCMQIGFHSALRLCYSYVSVLLLSMLTLM